MAVPDRDDAMPAAIARALRDDGVAEACRVFRAGLGAASGGPGMDAWFAAGWVAFLPGQRDALAPAVEAARSDALASDLLLARVLVGTGHEVAGLEAVRAAVARAPGRSAPRLMLCAMLLKRADPEAQIVLRECLERYPGAASGWDDLGLLLLGLGKAEAALVCFRRGVPGVEAAMRRGRIARDLGRLAEARQAFGEAARIDRRATRAWFLLGTCAQDQRDFAAAAAAYETALALEPRLAEAALNLGTVRQETGDLDGAKSAYRQAVRTRGDTFGRVAQALATSPRGELWLDLGRLRRSLAD